MDPNMVPVITAVRHEIPARRAVLRECSEQAYRAIDARPLWLLIYRVVEREEGQPWTSR